MNKEQAIKLAIKGVVNEKELKDLIELARKEKREWTKFEEECERRLLSITKP